MTSTTNRTLFFLYFISLSLYLYFLISGTDFYLTALRERPHHSDYRIMRPAGFEGHAFGVIGSTMMIFMLFYSIRKRTRRLQNFGNLSNWLKIHIYFGIMGPLLIILHSSFKVQGLIAVSFWSMITVALSGVLGRYLYIQIPRTISGKELDLKELKDMDNELNQKIAAEFHLSKHDAEILEKFVSTQKSEQKNILNILFSMIITDFIRPIRYLLVKRRLRILISLDKKNLKKLAKSVQKKELLERRISLWQSVHQLFHYWHILHKPFAILMYIIMLVHILIAIYVGYIWIF